jgi:hypothetical protein
VGGLSLRGFRDEDVSFKVRLQRIGKAEQGGWMLR